ncbi:TauD/TfdA family dioxygenase [Saccharothrix sp. 6-C]|uniref:TauD/TfdA dioxygenase family protein n=1 Tax=Saccharothrix sp. 6-C TaxID=2781735 RepID=UPI0019174BE7|nr:TauD/TfdA family dioxygenase [Saccharothrix sp. 6-C]QQQ80020.1 TauD/TfdA family dioxygenase [Saccharothrix sp. 6-C]
MPSATTAADTAWGTEPLTPFGALLTAPSPGLPFTAPPVEDVRALVRAEHLVVLRGFTPPADGAALEAYGRSWGEVLEWSFGTVFDVLAHEEPEDHAFDTGFMPMHWDGMYARHVPEFQIFHCLTAPDTTEGGRTLFTDTTKVLADTDPATVRRWRSVVLHYRNPKVSHYGGLVISPLVEPHPVTGAPTLRFLEPVPEGVEILNPPDVTVADHSPEEARAVVAEVRGALYDPRHLYAHSWEPGDILITDNYTLLHTREPYRRGLPRHLQRVHVLGTPPHLSHLNA